MPFSNLFVKKVVQDLTSGGVDWQREKWQSGFGSKFIRQGEKNAVKYADEIIVLSKDMLPLKSCSESSNSAEILKIKLRRLLRDKCYICVMEV